MHCPRGKQSNRQHWIRGRYSSFQLSVQSLKIYKLCEQFFKQIEALNFDLGFVTIVMNDFGSLFFMFKNLQN